MKILKYKKISHSVQWKVQQFIELIKKRTIIEESLSGLHSNTLMPEPLSGLGGNDSMSELDTLTGSDSNILMPEPLDESCSSNQNIDLCTYNNDINVVSEALKIDIEYINFASENLINNRQFLNDYVEPIYNQLPTFLEMVYFLDELTPTCKAKEYFYEKREDLKKAYCCIISLERQFWTLLDRITRGLGQRLSYNIRVNFFDNLNYTNEQLDDYLNDLDIWKHIIKYNYSLLEYAPDHIKFNRELIKLSIDVNPASLMFAGDILKFDRDIILRTLAGLNERLNEDFSSLTVLTISGSKYNSDKEVMLSAIDTNPNAVILASVELKADFDIMMSAVTSQGRLLSEASKELKKNQLLVAAAIRRAPDSFTYADHSLQNNKDFICRILEEQYHCYKYLDDQLKQNEKIALIAVKKNQSEELKKSTFGFSKDPLCFIHKSLRQNHSFSLKAISQNVEFFEVVSDELKADKTIVAEAVKRDGLMLKLAAKEMKQDIDILSLAVNQNGLALEFVSEDFPFYKILAADALDNNGEALKFLSNNIKENDDDYEWYVKKAVASSPQALQLVPETLNNNKHIVELAVRKDGTAIQYAGSACKQDTDIAISAIAQCQSAIEYVELFIDPAIILRDLESCLASRWNTPKYIFQLCLFGIKDERSSLARLNTRYCQEDLLNIIKLKISDFAGIQQGRSYARLKNAVEHLS